jgi:hypothetical protein
MNAQLAGPQPDWPAAAALFRDTVRRDAASPQRWCELGEAIGKTGDLARADYCYRRGGALGPHALKILLDLGDFYFNTRAYHRSLPYFSEILKTMRGPGQFFSGTVFEYYEAMEVRRNGWLGEAIPDGESARDYIQYLMTSREAGPVTELWQWADRRGFTNDEIAIRLADFLVQRQQPENAAQIWAKHFSGRGYGCAGDPCVFNGDFEHEIIEGPFDWRFSGMDGVKTERDTVSRYEGQASLRVEFTGNNNPDFHHINEQILIKPGRYRLEGYVRTVAITSDEGIRLRVTGSSRTKNMKAETGAVSGTEGWKRLETEFDVPAEIRSVELQVARRKSIRIDNQLSGTAWIDSVRLTRIHRGEPLPPGSPQEEPPSAPRSRPAQ